MPARKDEEPEVLGPPLDPIIRKTEDGDLYDEDALDECIHDCCDADKDELIDFAYYQGYHDAQRKCADHGCMWCSEQLLKEEEEDETIATSG